MATSLFRRLHSRVAGFSLIELVTVMVLLGIVAAVAAPFISDSFKAYFTGRDLVETDWQGRVALERMTRELRTVRAPVDLTMTSVSDLTFVDVDGNSVRYFMSNCVLTICELTRLVPPSVTGQPLATGISGLAFTYLLRDGKTTTVAPASVYYIIVDFTANQGGNSRTYQATVSPRNFP